MTFRRRGCSRREGRGEEKQAAGACGHARPLCASCSHVPRHLAIPDSVTCVSSSSVQTSSSDLQTQKPSSLMTYDLVTHVTGIRPPSLPVQPCQKLGLPTWHEPKLCALEAESRTVWGFLSHRTLTRVCTGEQWGKNLLWDGGRVQKVPQAKIIAPAAPRSRRQTQLDAR